MKTTKKKRRAVRKVKIVNKLDVSFYNMQPVNPMLSTAQARIMYAGLNRNGTYFSKKFIEEQMVQTLLGTPLVGEYIRAKEDFGDHGGDIDIVDGEIAPIYTTQAYGFVPLNSPVWWEEVQEADGTAREYLCCNVIVWTGRYAESKRIVEEGNNQSMEIDPDTMAGVWVKDKSTNTRYLEVTQAWFSALTVLGEDVEPCFESSVVGRFTLDEKRMEEITNEVANYQAEIDPEKLEKLWAENLKSAGSKTHIIIGGANYTHDSKTDSNNNEGGNVQMKNKFAFGLSHGQVREAIFNAINPYDTEAGYTFNYSIGPVFDDHVVVYKYEDGKYYGMNYQKVDEKIVPGTMYNLNHEFITDDEKTSIAQERDTQATSYKALEDDNAKLKTDFAKSEEDKKEAEGKYATAAQENLDLGKTHEEYKVAKETELEELTTLREFKAVADKQAKIELIGQFSALDSEILDKFKEDVDKYNLDELKAKLAVTAFENKVNFSLKTDGDDFEPGDGDNHTNYSGKQQNSGKPAFLVALEARR